MFNESDNEEKSKLHFEHHMNPDLAHDSAYHRNLAKFMACVREHKDDAAKGT